MGEIILAIALFLVGTALFFKPDRIPGDLGDARFTMYVLEHGYRWLLHLDRSFWSAPFFYPAPNVITYADSHLGSVWFYSLYRILGANRETAFQLWAITLFALNYSATWLVLRAQKFHPIGAITGAYIFTFSLIMAGQIGHMQLAPRFMIPLAFWTAYRFMENGRPRIFRWLLLACAYQLYLSIYIGYFLILSLVPFSASIFFYHQQWRTVRIFIETGSFRRIFRRVMEYAVCCFGFILILLPLIIPYYLTKQEQGGRAWEEVSKTLPRWQSYIHAPAAFVWGNILHFGDSLPYGVEHQLFVGLVPCIGIFIILYLIVSRKLKPSDSSAGLAMVVTLLTCALLTCDLLHGSIYFFLWTHLPAAGAFRAVARIMLVLVYPVAFVTGLVVTHVMNCARIGRLLSGFAGIGILAIVVIDQGARIPAFEKDESERRVDELKAKINGSSRSVLLVCEKGYSVYEQLDAMLAAQDLGLNVVNGYSGLAPRDYPSSLWNLTGDMCQGLSIWARLHPGMITKQNLLQVGQTCEIPDHDYLPIPEKGFGGFETRGDTLFLRATNRSTEFSVPKLPNGNSWKMLSFDLSTLRARTIKISGPGVQVQTINLLPGEPHHTEIVLPPVNEKTIIKFDTKKVKFEKGDPSVFEVSNLHLRAE